MANRKERLKCLTLNILVIFISSHWKRIKVLRRYACDSSSESEPLKWVMPGKWMRTFALRDVSEGTVSGLSFSENS